MPVPKYLSAEKYSKESGLGVEEVKRQCKAGKIPCFMTEGGYYKIPVYEDDVVPIDRYKEEKRKRIEAETKLTVIRKMLSEG